jgi:hypothetical protein
VLQCKRSTPLDAKGAALKSGDAFYVISGGVLVQNAVP